MKNRNIAYGYRYANGIIEPHPQERQIVREVYDAYLQGKSLRQITEWLNERQIEYMPGVVAWNKARIMRMLEDKRYLGDERHPAIIDRETYELATSTKDSKNEQKETDRQADIFRLNVPVRCPHCNSLMKRRGDSRWATYTRWNCTNKDCKTVISIADETLLEHIAELLNSVIANPHIVTIPTEKKNEPSIELIRLNNEISRLFDSTEIDRETARAKILEYASAQYRETDSIMTIAHRLKDTFTEAIPLTAFCPHLFERTVDEIKLYADGKVGIILTNNQEIRNGGQYGTT